jgi:hypothetical protein
MCCLSRLVSEKGKRDRSVEIAACIDADDLIELGRLPMSWQGC